MHTAHRQVGPIRNVGTTSTNLHIAGQPPASASTMRSGRPPRLEVIPYATAWLVRWGNGAAPLTVHRVFSDAYALADQVARACAVDCVVFDDAGNITVHNSYRTA